MATYEEKLAAWNKATPIIGYNSAIWRRDDFGWVIGWAHYGNRDSDYGWELDHVRPTALGGLETTSNIRAPHWRNNVRLGGLLGGALG